MQEPSVKSDVTKEALACFNGIGGHAKEAVAAKLEAPMIEAAAAAEALACFNGIGGHGKVAE